MLIDASITARRRSTSSPSHTARTSSAPISPPSWPIPSQHRPAGLDVAELGLRALGHGADHGYKHGGMVGELAGDLLQSGPQHLRLVAQRVHVGPIVVDEHVHRVGPGQSFDDDCTHIVVTGPARRHTCRRVPVPSGYWLSAGSGSRALSGSSECREPGRRSGSAPIHPAPSAHPGLAAPARVI